MALVHNVPPIPGVKDLFTLLAFLNDRERAVAHLAHMERVREEINALVEAYGAVQQIEGLRIQAADDRNSARLLLEEANAESAKAKAQAKKTLDEAKAEAAELLLRLEKDREGADRQIAEHIKHIESQQAALKAKEESLARREAEAEALMKRGQDLVKEFTEKIVRLKAAGVV